VCVSVTLIDTHCHLDADVFDADREQVLQQSQAAGVGMIVIPAVMPSNFTKVAALSKQYAQCCYALGIHPMFIDDVSPSDIARLNASVTEALTTDNQLVAIGEIGLDFFTTKQNRETQEYFFCEQLKVAQTHDLPVILHVRNAIDDVLKHLRQVKVKGGIAHAFNGSLQQAETFIKLGFKLGFGGAMTYPRALKIRALAKNLPLDAIVLETDAPDMPPVWLEKKERNTPESILKIAETLAALRRIPVSQIIEITQKNAEEVLPKIAHLYTPVQALH
jgi:TatD DNase family protein